MAASLSRFRQSALRIASISGALCWPSGFDKRFDQRLVAVAPQGGEVLALAHQRCERVVTSGKAQTHLLDGGRGRGLVRPLGDREGFATELRLGLKPLPRRSREIGEMANKIVRALLDETARAL